MNLALIKGKWIWGFVIGYGTMLLANSIKFSMFMQVN